MKLADWVRGAEWQLFQMLLVIALAVHVLCGCAPEIPELLPPTDQTPAQAVCARAQECELVEPGYTFVCVACTDMWVTLNRLESQVQTYREQVMQAPCATLKELATKTGILACYAANLENVKKAGIK